MSEVMKGLLCLLVFSTLALGDLVRVPGGYQFPEECVHHIDHDDIFMVERDGVLVAEDRKTGKLLKVIPKCNQQLERRRHGIAWKAWTQLTPNPSIESLVSTWKVPGDPKQPGSQTLYLWNGLEPGDTSAVLQPVLQWGFGADGGGQYWGVASWYVSSNHGAVWSRELTLKTGDVITGYNLKKEGSTWSAIANANGQNVTLSHQAFLPYTTAYHVLEAYNVGSQCSLYPDEPEKFYNIKIQPNSAKYAWSTHTKDNLCGEHAVVLDAEGRSVQIDYSK